MSFLEFCKNYLSKNIEEKVLTGKDILREFKLSIKNDDDYTQFMQLASLTAVKQDFVVSLYKACKDNTYLDLLDKDITLFNDKKIPANVYSYFIYCILTIGSIECDENDWFDVSNQAYESYISKNKNYGIGLIVPSLENFLLSEDNKTLFEVKNNCEYTIIPYGIENINSNAFNNKEIINLFIPNSVTCIEEGTFNNLSKLFFVKLSNKIDIIPRECFKNCSSLSYIKANSIKKVDDRAFENSGIVSIDLDKDKYIEEYGDSVFKDCKELYKYDLLNAKRVGKGLFSNCENLSNLVLSTDIKIGEKNSVYELFLNDVGAFNSKLDKIDVICDDGIIPNGFFKGLGEIKNINISGNVNKIGKGAFKNCYKLQKLQINFVGDTIEEESFYNCLQLQNINLDGINSIKTNAFYGCEGLTSINLNKTKEIEEKSFLKCLNMESINLCSDLLINGSKGRFVDIFGGIAIDLLNDGYKLTKLNVTCKDGVIKDNFFENLYPVKQIIINGVVNTIGKSAFNNCHNLENLEIDFQGNEIPDFAFNNCKNLTKFDFSKVETVGKNGFSGCAKLVSNIDLITNFGENSFCDCASIENIKISKDVKHIGKGAFNGCSLSEFCIQKGIFYEKGAFAGIKDFNTIIVNCGSIYNSSKSAMKFHELFSNDIASFNNKYHVKKAIVNYTYLIDSAFEGWENLEEVEFTKVIKILPSKVFNNCINLKKVTINKELLYIRDEAFYNCNNLIMLSSNGDETFELSNKTLIGKGAFFGCKNISNVDISNSIVSEEIFKDCFNIKTITISNSTIKNIDRFYKLFTNSLEEYNEKYEESLNVIVNGDISLCNNFFADLKNVESITINGNVSELGDSCFENDENLIKVVGDSNILEITNNCFKNCSKLQTTINFNKVTTIQKDAFNGCRSLENLTTGDISYIGENAFKDCVSLEEINGICSCQEIERGVFSNCQKLNLSFLKNLKIANQCAFENCDCTTLTFETITAKRESFKKALFNENFVIDNRYNVEYGAFLNAAGFDQITLMNPNIINKADGDSIDLYRLFSDSISEFNREFREINKVTIVDDNVDFIMYGWSNITDVVLKNVTVIPEQCFSNCTSLTNVIYDDALKEIKRMAFSGCFDLQKFTKTGEYVIDLHNISVGENAFSGCSQFSNIVIDIENPYMIFAYCTNIKKLTIYQKQCNNIHKLFTDDVDDFNDKYKNLVELEFPIANSISDKAFYGYANIKQIGFNCQIDTIGTYAFDSCINLTNLQIDYVGKLVPEGCFKSCCNLNNLKFENVVSIGDRAFEKCKKLTNIYFLQEIQYIGSYAFEDCIELVNLSLNFVGDTLYKNTFSGCVNLEKIPNLRTIKDIELPVFYGDYNIREVSIGAIQHPLKDVFSESYDQIVEVNFYGKQIPDNFFLNMKSLKHITFNDEIIEIGESAFANTSSLEQKFTFKDVKIIHNFVFSNSSILSVTINNDVERVGTGIFEKCYSLKNITLPINFSNVHSLFGAGLSLNYKKYNLEEINLTSGVLLPNMFIDFPFNINMDFEVTKIPDNCFSSNKSLYLDFSKVTEVGINSFKNINLDYIHLQNVQKISERSFVKCNINNLTISKDIKGIQEGAFVACNIKSLVIQKDVEHLAIELFKNCNIENINNYSENYKYYDEGFLVDIQNGEIVFVNSHLSNHIIIPKEVLYIQRGQFKGHYEIEYINTSKVIDIGENAFEDCTGLNEVIIQKRTNIGRDIFEGCTNIKKLAISCINRDKEYIDINSLFGNTKIKLLDNLVILGGNISRIDFTKSINVLDLAEAINYTLTEDMFVGLNIGKLILPKTLIDVDTCVFANCKVDQIEEFDNEMVSFNKGCLIVNNKLIYVTQNITKLVIMKDITEIAPNIELPKVTTLELGLQYSDLYKQIFKMVPLLKKVIFMKNINIPISELIVDQKIKEIVYYPKTYIKGCFWYLKDLEKISLPNITCLEENTFVGDSNLLRIDNIDKVLEIQENVFQGLNHLEYVKYPINMTEFNPICFSNVGEIDFAHCKNFHMIGGAVLDKNTDVVYVQNVSDISIEGNIRNIKPFAFMNCDLLKSIEISSAKTICQNAFYNLPKLEKVIIKEAYHFECKIFNKCMPKTRLEIPYIGEFSTSLGCNLDFLFKTSKEKFDRNLIKIKNVVIKHQQIFKNTFAWCGNIKRVEFPEATNICDYCFRNCTSLEKLKIPITTIEVEDFSFIGCDYLTVYIWKDAKWPNKSKYWGDLKERGHKMFQWATSSVNKEYY